MIEPNTIICGDCLKIMREIPDKSVSFVWTDPPYNVGKNYGNYNDSMPDGEYLSWCSGWIIEAKRISNNKIAIYIPMKYKLEFWNMLGKDYREIQLTWGPEGAIRFGYRNQFCTILSNVLPIKPVHNVWYNCQMTGLGWFFRENNFGHPGYTSEDVTMRILNAFTRARELIFDPFGGSGTTAKCCIKMDRDFILCEQEEHWCNIAQKRVDAELAQLKLAL